MLKCHFTVPDNGGVLCGRIVRNQTADASRVTCISCREDDRCQAVGAEQAAAREASIMAQEPKQVTNPWTGATIECRNCGTDQFRDEGRSLDFNHYRCAACGTKSQTMTETGMCR